MFDGRNMQKARGELEPPMFIMVPCNASCSSPPPRQLIRQEKLKNLHIELKAYSSAPRLPRRRSTLEHVTEEQKEECANHSANHSAAAPRCPVRRSTLVHGTDEQDEGSSGQGDAPRQPVRRPTMQNQMDGEFKARVSTLQAPRKPVRQSTLPDLGDCTETSFVGTTNIFADCTETSFIGTTNILAQRRVQDGDKENDAESKSFSFSIEECKEDTERTSRTRCFRAVPYKDIECAPLLTR